jgi:hypothetical protein
VTSTRLATARRVVPPPCQDNRSSSSSVGPVVAPVEPTKAGPIFCVLAASKKLRHSMPEESQRSASLGMDGFPKGSTLRARMNSRRKAAGIESVEEELARENDPPPLRNIPLTICCSLLMVVASRASQNLTRVMDDSGGKPLESVRMLSYGFTLMNLMGGFGAITFGIFPGKIAWVHQLMEEASTSVGTALLAVGIADLTDDTGFWTDNESYTSRMVIMGVGGLHSVLKSMFHSYLTKFVQVVAFASAVLMFRVGLKLQDTNIVGCALLSILSNARHHKVVLPFLSTRGAELACVSLALLCFVLEATCLERYGDARSTYTQGREH